MLVAIGTLVAQVFALGHLVLFSHARCEHGALVHVRGHNGRATDRPLVPLHGIACLPASAERDADHDHCDAVGTPPALAVLKAPSLHRAPIDDRLARQMGARDASRSESILSLAPKTSPTV
jgi:hypothetical protein